MNTLIKLSLATIVAIGGATYAPSAFAIAGDDSCNNPDSDCARMKRKVQRLIDRKRGNVRRGYHYGQGRGYKRYNRSQRSCYIAYTRSGRRVKTCSY